MTLNRNPTNYFAEVEQVAFCTNNLVPGIEPTNDPLLQARLFSYVDTQLTRLGGPNFSQIPINRPHAPVNDMLRDGMHQMAIHTGLAPYRPNSIDDGLPNVATATEGAYVNVPRPIEGTVVREARASFDDHFSQATLFYRSLTPIEQVHLTEAFTFELGKVYSKEIKARELSVLARVDAGLATKIAEDLGLPAPEASNSPAEVTPSPALSQITGIPGPIAGRKVGIIADAGADLASITQLLRGLTGLGAVGFVIAPVGGTLGAGRSAVAVDRTPLTARSIEFDAIVVAGGTTPTNEIRTTILLQEAFRHCKALGAWGGGEAAIAGVGIDLKGPGVLVADAFGKPFLDELVRALGLHRVWERAEAGMASAVPPASNTGAPAKANGARRPSPAKRR
jgi:catalase